MPSLSEGKGAFLLSIFQMTHRPFEPGSGAKRSPWASNLKPRRVPSHNHASVWRIVFRPSTRNMVLPTRSRLFDGREKALFSYYTLHVLSAPQAGYSGDCSRPRTHTGSTSTSLYNARKEHMGVWLDPVWNQQKPVPKSRDSPAHSQDTDRHCCLKVTTTA